MAQSSIETKPKKTENKRNSGQFRFETAEEPETVTSVDKHSYFFSLKKQAALFVGRTGLYGSALMPLV